MRLDYGFKAQVGVSKVLGGSVSKFTSIELSFSALEKVWVLVVAEIIGIRPKFCFSRTVDRAAETS
jgi:hypothetical protein